MSKELAKKEAAQLAEYGGLMDSAPVAARDVMIPKLLLMQGLSKFVGDEKAKVGEIRNSVTGDLKAAKGKAIEFIPFKVFKTWLALTVVGNKFKGVEPVTLENALRKWDGEVDGEPVNNYMMINYYCLLPDDIKKGQFTPYVISFKSSSYKAGKVLETRRAELQEFNTPLCFKTFELGGELEENDKGKYYVFTVKEKRNTEDSELQAVKHWKGVIDSAEGFVVDDSEFEGDTVDAEHTTKGEVTGDDKF